ncbi:MAG: histidine triad nucleotide-binding protein [Patescibacteria group bacterium]
MDCLFCKIIEHKLPAKIRFENEDFIAFDDIDPQAKVHILVIPKKHIPSVAALADDEMQLIGRLILVARDIAHDLGLDETGYRLVFNSGPNAGQAVDHIHLHILGGNKLGPIA